MKVGRLIYPIRQDYVKILVDKEVEEMEILNRIVYTKIQKKEEEYLLLIRIRDFERNGEEIEMLRDSPFKEVFSEEGKVTLTGEVITVYKIDSKKKRRVVPYSFPVKTEEVYLADTDLIEKAIYRHVKFPTCAVGKEIGGFEFRFVFPSFSKMGEGYHILVSGTTGSGKTTEVKKLLVGFAQNEEMNFLIFDPQGEFSRDFRNSPDKNFPIEMGKIWNSLNRNYKILSLNDVVLDTWEDFEVVFSDSRAFEIMGINHPEKKKKASHYTRRYFEYELGYKDPCIPTVAEPPFDFFTEPAFLKLYSSEEKRNEIIESITNPKIREKIEEVWREEWEIFNESKVGGMRVEEIVKNVIGKKGETIIIDTSEISWRNPLKSYLIYAVARELIKYSSFEYRKGEKANCIVVLDEAHRIIPAGRYGDNRLKEEIVTALRETRKYGIGWIIISTSISNIDKESFQLSRVKIIGFGLNAGRDAELLREELGKEAVNLYRKFVSEPLDFLSGERNFSFLIQGVINVLSSRTPFVYKAFNYHEFEKRNDIAKKIAKIQKELEDFLSLGDEEL
jgi:DNA helicase HerA-like ATPase